MKRLAFRAKTEIVGRSSLRTDREFASAEALSAEQLADLGQARALAHARFAMEHSPFYRDYYTAHGIRLKDLQDPAVLSELPFTDKALVRENFARIATDEATPRSSSVSRTGGSTGLPLRLLRDDRFPARALEWRLFRWWGVDPWANRAIITRHMLTGRAKALHDLQWLPSRRVQLDAYRINDDTAREFARQWNSTQPQVLIGYGGGVLDTLRRLRRLGIELAPPRAVGVTAAPLAPSVRREIEDEVGTPCYDHYRAAEVPWIAGECTHRTGLHVFADVRRVEILDDEDRAVAHGTEGNVVVSDLTNRVFPMIRYRLGDISSLLPDLCGCGRALPRLGVISGRSSDALRLPNGTTIAGALGHIFDDTPYAVRQFEIEQAEDYSVVLRAIPSTEPDALRDIDAAFAKLRNATQGTVPVELELVDDIPQTGGKMRFIRSAAPTTPPPVSE